MSDLKVSGFVITYNRAHMLRACLLRLRWVDELIVVDKSSTDDTEAVARSIADRYERVPWSPIAEDTRAYAESLCSHDWVFYLDDDEILTRDARVALIKALEKDPSPVYQIPFLDYYFGRYDYRVDRDQGWRPSFYRKGELIHQPSVHTPPLIPGGKDTYITDGSIAIHNLSLSSVSEWVGKVNRYATAACQEWPSRFNYRFSSRAASVYEFACDALDRFNQNLARIGGEAELKASDHCVASMMLFYIYDLIEGLKFWELDNNRATEEFAAICAEVEREAAVEP